VKYHLSHGLSVAVMLPCVMEHNLIGNPEKYANVAQAMGERIEGLSVFEAAYRSVEAMKRLLQDLSLPLRLREVGAKKEDFQTFSETVFKLYSHLINNNPRDMQVEDVRKVYESAW